MERRRGQLQGLSVGADGSLDGNLVFLRVGEMVLCVEAGGTLCGSMKGFFLARRAFRRREFILLDSEEVEGQIDN